MARLVAVELGDRGYQVSTATVSRWLVRLGLTGAAAPTRTADRSEHQAPSSRVVAAR